MTEQSPETPAPPAGEGGEGRPLESRVDSLEAKIDAILERLPGGSSAPQPAGQAPTESEVVNVRAETRAAVAEVQRREAAKKARDHDKAAQEARLAAIEDKVKEKPPREYRRATRWMKWTTEADER